VDVILTAAVTANGMIARHANETVNWSADLALFREQTMGHTVVMGSHTEATLATDLDGREVVIMHREMNPEDVLAQVRTESCFIIGGARTYSRFAPHLTHVYLTFHPFIFRSDAIPLFYHLDSEVDLTFEKRITVSKEEGIYQFQYKVNAVV
jgi:dihydrofolate reductase